MKRRVTFITILSAIVFAVTGCANSATESSGNPMETVSGAEVSVVTSSDETSDPLMKTSSKSVLQEIKLGEKLSGTAYLYSAQGGVNSYYIHGRYVLTNDNTVTQIRQEIEVEDVKTSLREIISQDADFDLSKAEVTFYGSDGKTVSGSLDEPLSSVITDCVVEYVEWLDDAKTYGKVQSYLFTYGYVPTKVIGYYDKNAVESSDTESTASDTESTVSSAESSASADDSTAQEE